MRAAERANGEKDQVDPQHHTPPVAVADDAREQPAERRAAERDGVEDADVGSAQPPSGAQCRPDDTDRILLEAVEQTAKQDKRDDLLVRVRNADLRECAFELPNGWIV